MESTIQISEFKTANNEILAERVMEYVEDARKGYEANKREFAKKVENSGAFEAIRWNGEGLIAAELSNRVAEIVLETMENDKTPAEAIEVANRYLQQQIVEGTTSTWSGLMTNEAAKARGKAAYEMTSWGSWESLITSGQHRALFAVCKAEIVAVNNARNFLRDAMEKKSRARTDASLERLSAVVENAEAALTAKKDLLAAVALSKGVPSDLIREYTS